MAKKSIVRVRDYGLMIGHYKRENLLAAAKKEDGEAPRVQ